MEHGRSLFCAEPQSSGLVGQPRAGHASAGVDPAPAPGLLLFAISFGKTQPSCEVASGCAGCAGCRKANSHSSRPRPAGLVRHYSRRRREGSHYLFLLPLVAASRLEETSSVCLGQPSLIGLDQESPGAAAVLTSSAGASAQLSQLSMSLKPLATFVAPRGRNA